MQNGELPYATCFLCGKLGHLASKCEQSTTGIYPKGGGCHECGSPYHLVKNCPTRKANVKIGTTNDNKDGDDNINSNNRREKTKSGFKAKKYVQAKSTKLQKVSKNDDDDDNDAYWMS